MCAKNDGGEMNFPTYFVGNDVPVSQYQVRSYKRLQILQEALLGS